MLELDPSELEEILFAAGICVWSLDARSQQVRMSHNAEQLFGVPPREIPDIASFQSLVHPDDRLRRVAALDAALASGGDYEVDYRVVRPDGVSTWLRSRGSVELDRAGQPLRHRGVLFSIDAQKRAEEAQTQVEMQLRRREAQLRSLLESVPGGVVVVDGQGGVKSLSAAAQALFGVGPAEMGGCDVRALVPALTPEMLVEIAARPHPRMNAEPGDARLEGRRRDGSAFPLGLAIGQARPEGETVYTLFVSDLSDVLRTQARLHELQSELVHAARFGAMGQLAAALAHELNQPLSAIANYTSGCVRLLENEGLARQDAIGAALRACSGETLKAGQIIRRLRGFIERGFSERCEAEKRVEPVADLVEEACAIALRGAEAQGISIAVRFDADLQTVLADRSQIQQVLVTLLDNARDAVANAPVKQIVVSARRPAPGMAELAVSDSGSGIGPEVADRLFQPFVTTKPGGMGVGLFISRTIVEAHGGSLTMEQTPGCGTTFRIGPLPDHDPAMRGAS